uniref:acylneuraminate cytidylyltransferase family protein n=1 Tax=Aliarcobacter sp. TaxID=2321116 RepID=UPI0040482F82
MKKIIAMVPARIGSKRVPKKNLRLIDGKPLIGYILETLKKVKMFDEIYLNADDLVFQKIADEYGVKFYHRDKQFSTDKSTNDEFALDFMENIEGDILLQVLPTSPLITSKEIEEFTQYMLDNTLETLISVEHKQIACLYKNQTLNFDKYKKNPPSQEMEPVKAYATVLMGWEYNSFKENMKKYGCAYHGGDSKIDYYQVKGLSTIDIDNEEDFLLAEAIITALKNQTKNDIKFYE